MELWQLILLLVLAAWAVPCRYDPAIRLKERMERKRKEAKR